MQRTVYILFSLLISLAVYATKVDLQPNSSTWHTAMPNDTLYISQKGSYRVTIAQIGKYHIEQTTKDTIDFKLQANPPKQIIVIGHTCNKGTEDSNLDLGILRAEKVRYLLQQSLPYINIQTETQGEAHPLLPNTNEHNRQENRRVEMIYIY